MSAYAFLNEIWDSSLSETKHASPQCSLKNGKLDNIMDAYMKEPVICEEEETKVEKPCVDIDHLEGWDNSPILKNAYCIEDDYKNELALMKKEVEVEVEEESIPYCFEERVPKPYIKEEVYRNILEKYNNSKNKQQDNYIELIIYVLSGIFLIFLMEQILQIGKHIKV